MSLPRLWVWMGMEVRQPVLLSDFSTLIPGDNFLPKASCQSHSFPVPPYCQRHSSLPLPSSVEDTRLRSRLQPSFFPYCSPHNFIYGVAQVGPQVALLLPLCPLLQGHQSSCSAYLSLSVFLPLVA